MALNCTTPKYEKLYARWLANPGDLLRRGALRQGERVLDLCGGTGILAREALRLGAGSATVLDLNPRCTDDGVTTVRGHAEDVGALLTLAGLTYDLVACRQAVGYLDLARVARGVQSVLSPRGRFVFNNFKRPKWSAKVYRFGGRSYLEASAYWGNRVWHLQGSPMLGADITRFRWWRDEEVIEALEPHFDVEVEETPKTLYYVCVPRCL